MAANVTQIPSAFALGAAVPDWLNKGDNAWQLTSATLVGMQSVPGLVILYGGIVKKKWAVNSAFMALYAFAAVLLVWVTWAYKLSFGDQLCPIWGKGGVALTQEYLLTQSILPATAGIAEDGSAIAAQAPLYPAATMVFFQFVFAAISVILIAGSLLGRMNFIAWMVFVPMWITFVYTFGAFSVWGGGFLYQWGVMDYSGGYVIHVTAGFSGLTAAYWVGPRLQADRDRFPPNNVLLTLAGAGLLWMGWSGFNGGDPYAANISASIAVLNTHVCTATSLLVWTILDVLVFGKPSVIGAVQGMITGLVCITPAAGFVEGWAAIVLGVFSGSVPWFTMQVLHRRWTLLQKIDDTLGVFHTHGIAGFLGGVLTGLFAQGKLSDTFLGIQGLHGTIYGGTIGGLQLGKQVAGALFIIGWNVVFTSLICIFIRYVLRIPLRVSDEELLVGDVAIHDEDSYAIWGDGERFDPTKHSTEHDASSYAGVAAAAAVAASRDADK